jgi:hypothetical protein
MRILVIALDGATWRVIDPLLEERRMPNLARLIERGTRCKTKAFEPVLSPIIWTTLASGKQPEKHGVTHFFNTANNVRCKRLWDILEGPERPVGTFAWPVTWPPHPVNGFMVPSLFARTHDTFPPELRFIKELEDGLGKGWDERIRLIGTAMRHGLRVRTVADTAGYVLGRMLGRYGDLDHFARQRFIKQEIHLDIYTSLVRQYDPYFTAFYLNQIDAFSHKFWHYYEPHHFLDGKAEDMERYSDMIPRVYQKADEAVGQLLRLTEKDTLVVVVSDHGFESALDANKGDKFVCRLLGDNLLSALDLASTVRYVNHLNKLVLQILRQRQEVLALLRAIQVEEMDRPLLDLFEESTGEVILRVAEPNSYRDVDLGRLHVAWPGGRRPFLGWVETRSFSTPGVHQSDGIAVFCGPGVRPSGRVADGSVLDLTPTVLALLGMPVARDMDGKVMTGAIAPEFLEESPITYIDTYDSDLVWNEVEDEEPMPVELMARLRGLGYMG